MTTTHSFQRVHDAAERTNIELLLNRVHRIYNHRNRANETSNMPDVLDNVLKNVQSHFKMNKIVIVKIISHKTRISADILEHVEAVLFQLIVASLKAMKDKPGILTIEAEDKPWPFSQEKNRVFMLRVSDTIVSDKENLEENSFDQNLALFVTKKIAEYYGGVFRVKKSAKGNSVHLHILHHCDPKSATL